MYIEAAQYLKLHERDTCMQHTASSTVEPLYLDTPEMRTPPLIRTL